MRQIKQAPIAQLDRAFDYGSKGLGFDSYWARHKKFKKVFDKVRQQ